MEEIISILTKHKSMYPLMQFEDAYKLIYQHCYGPKHLFISKEEALKYIKSEATICEHIEKEIIDIGNDYVRISIINRNDYLNALCDAFYETVKNCNKEINIEKILEKNKIEICELFNVDLNDYSKRISYLKENNFPAISHSEVYKLNYFPHYRVISKKYIRKEFLK